MEGNVYLITEEGSVGKYKIGCTRQRDVNKRLKALQTGNPSKLSLISSFSTNKPYKLESMLHNYFKEKHSINEWYELNADEVEDFNSLCVKFQTIIESLEDNPFFK